jgi:ABC-type oligopeptide transport system substrate-binding subunit
VVGRLAVATLEQLGYRASLKVVADDARYWDMISDSRTGAQASFFAWQQDYPSASNFLAPLLTCSAFQPADIGNLNVSQICDARIDRAVALATRREGSDATSRATWAAADRAATDSAPWVPLVNTRDVAIVSRRVHNVQSNAQWGVLTDQMWVS